MGMGGIVTGMQNMQHMQHRYPGESDRERESERERERDRTRESGGMRDCDIGWYQWDNH